jgi:hypothetical protein
MFLSILISAPNAVMAGGTEGGTPPAREKLAEKLMAADFGQGALFDKGLGDVGLLTNRELLTRMTITKSQLHKADVKIPELDFDMLRDRVQPIDSVGTLGENKSYSISAGDELDSLILTDRRAAARSAFAQ